LNRTPVADQLFLIAAANPLDPGVFELASGEKVDHAHKADADEANAGHDGSLSDSSW
jgi:hypothetical protein